MFSLNYAQRSMLAIVISCVISTSLFWIAILYQTSITKNEHMFFLTLGLSMMVIQLVIAVIYGGRITRRILFEARLRSRLKTLRENLRKSERNSHFTKDRLFEGVLVIDDQFRVSSANRSAKKILKSLKNPDLNFNAIIRDPEMYELILQAKVHKNSIEKNVTIKDKDPIKLKTRAFSMPNGDILLLMLDVTRASAIDEKHNDFIAHASHELKTPISVMLANAELLVDQPTIKDADRPLLQAILRQALQAKKLLDSLLELLRLDAGQHSVMPEFIHLERFFDDVKASLGSYGVMIKNEVEKNCSIWADRALLERVSLIIIENTQKYGGACPMLTISACRLKRKIKVIFADNGPGIKPHFQERVFERFFRQPEHDRSDREGFGLGLSQARAIVHSMGGKILVDNSIQSGCAISLFFDVSSEDTGYAPFKETDEKSDFESAVIPGLTRNLRSVALRRDSEVLSRNDKLVFIDSLFRRGPGEASEDAFKVPQQFDGGRSY